MAKRKRTKRKNTGRQIVIAVIAVLLILLLALAGISNYLVTYAIGRSGDGGNRQVALDVEDVQADTGDVQTGEPQTAAEAGEAEPERTETFFAETPSETVGIVSRDGLNLSGVYFKQEGSHLWALLVHGYRANHESMGNYAREYYAQGYQVLTPDLRACGDSEGDYIGMGWLDRLDLLDWIDWILEKDPQAQIVMLGVSMGAAAVMMVSGEETPDAVSVFIEDCGYTSVWEVFSSELELRFHLPEFPVLYTASLVSGLRAGYSFTEASALEQVAKCEKPMLFIHGTADDFIPFEMEGELYEAKPGDNKAKIEVQGAGHGQSEAVLGEEYWEEVFSFIDTWMAE